MSENPQPGPITRLINVLRSNLLQQNDRIKPFPIELQEAYERYLPQVEYLYSNRSYYWHGTGRYQYRDGQVVDALDKIIQDKGLMPHKDVYDSKSGITNSTSFGLSRMYARTYSDMYLQEGKKPRYEYGPRAFWSSKFIGETAMSGVTETLHNIGVSSIAKDPKGFMTKLRGNNRDWIEKFRSDAHTNPKSIMRLFTDLQSDIKDNYPILIGVTQDGVKTSRTAGYINKYERRSTDPTNLQSFTHLEVPFEKVQEVERLLKEKGLEIPVIPIEVGERFCSQFSYDTLVKGGYLKKNMV